ncbi:BTB domain-containing protein [Favolaschia claudopus]|uniref:BTB domain-containing protein n=1 Tax=Favolaschia claudopus TaxID=2862362 RepID=A0AAW0CKC1_9AGAR
MSKTMQRVETLWFANGADVVLQAGDKIFRVPRSILTARSPVFRDLLEIPAVGDKIMDGVPVIQLSESAKEIEAFLKAIYDSSYFMPPPAPISFAEVFAILRLAHKYDVDYLFRRAVEHLETRYHQNLKDVESEDMFIVERITVQLKFSTGVQALMCHVFAVSILHEVEALWLLPYAYYIIARSRLKDLITPNEGWDYCPPYRKDVVFQARTLQVAATDRLLAALTSPSDCPTTDKCNLAKFAYLKRCLDSLNRYFAVDPIHKYALSGREGFVKKLCPGCAAEAQKSYSTVRQQIWDELPQNCGLPEWDVLRAMRKKRL